jgi:outer membrane biogenesis lipoprotein LolB
MNPRAVRWTALALASLLLVACKDKHDPLKPTVAQPAVVTAATAA